jgi:regulator of sigma E protease
VGQRKRPNPHKGTHKQEVKMVPILAVVFVLGVMIFVHELGHFIGAKLFRIRVERFSLGYPPRMVGKKIGDTDYCISWIPFGGYVKIAGMVDESLDKKTLKSEKKPWEFRSRPWIQKVLVIAAGPFMNLLLAFVVFFSVSWIYGVLDETGVWVQSVAEGKAAEQLGLKAGDKIVSLDGESVTSFEHFSERVRGAEGQVLAIGWVRGDSSFTGTVMPAAETIEENGETKTVGQIGIAVQIKSRKIGAGEALVSGGDMVIRLTKLIVVSIYKLIAGQESIRSVAGPIGIAKMAGDYARAGFGSLIVFMALLSLNLGIINLLPIPVLDGGHLVFLGIEGIIRKEIPVKVKLVVQQVGMVLIFALMVFVIYNDIIRILHK